MLWLIARPVEAGGYGYSWHDAIRMGPTQILFVIQSEEKVKQLGRYRNMKASGKTPADVRRESLEDMAARRRRFAGVESRDEL